MDPIGPDQTVITSSDCERIVIVAIGYAKESLHLILDVKYMTYDS